MKGIVCSFIAAFVALSCVHALTLTEPQVLSSTSTNWAVSLTVQVARFSNEVLAMTTRQFCYQGKKDHCLLIY
jgi:hypothetical protein